VSPATIRTVLRLVALAGVPGVIVSAIRDSTGGALTFGLITAASATALILVTAASTPPAAGPQGVDEGLAATVEARVAALVEAGADEEAVRALVGDAVALGRSAGGVAPRGGGPAGA
jgi:hypothetical protein